MTRPNYQAVAAVMDTALLSQESLSVVTGSPVIEVQPLHSTEFKYEVPEARTTKSQIYFV